MMSSRRQRDWANVLLGTYLLFSPWIFGTSWDVGRSSNAWIVGAYLVTIAMLGLVIPESRPIEWLKSAIGCWLLASPLVLGFENSGTWLNAWIVGALVIALVVVARLTLSLRISLRWMALRYRARKLSPEKIVGHEAPEEQRSPGQLSRQIVERSEQIHRALRKAPSEAEVEMYALGYQACANDLATLNRLVEEKLPKSGLIRRARFKVARRRAAGSLSRLHEAFPGGALHLHPGNYHQPGRD